MKKSVLLSLLLILVSLKAESQAPKKERSVFHGHSSAQSSRGSFTYLFSVLNEPYTDLSNPIPLNNGEVWDDPTYTVAIPFPFLLNGNPISSLQFFGTGMLLTAATSDPDIGTFVFPFEVDLVDRGFADGVSLSPISYKVEGTAGTRILKIEMKNAGSFIELDALGTTDMYINLQMWLYESSNRIEFRFGENLISNPDVFYADGGAICGITDYDMVNDVLINGHFLGGSAAAPQLSMTDVTLEGTPDDGTVYRFSLSPPIELTVTGQNANSFCNPNGSATASVTGGDAPFTYAWSNGETTHEIINLDAGVFSVTVTDANGETATGSVTITNVNPLNPNAGSTDETGVGLNDGTAYSAAFGGSPPYEYLWSNGETTQTITGLSPGIYTVTVTDDVGCTATQDVSVNAFGCLGFDLEVIAINVSCAGWCNGQIDILGVSGGTAPYMYEWSTGSTQSAIGNLCPGTYFLTVTDTDGCIDIESYTITEPPFFIAGAGASDQTNVNANDGSAWALPTGGTPPYSYQWNNAAIDSLITGLTPGAYFVTITDANGCLDSQSVVVLPVICALNLAGTSSNPSCADVCDGFVGVQVTGGTGSYEYLWSNGVVSSSLFGLCGSDTLMVMVNDLGNGCSITDSLSFIAPPALDATFHIIDYTDISAGSIDIKVEGGTPSYFYIWTGPNGYLSNDEDISGLVAGYYTVLVSDINGCSWSQDSLEVKDLTVGTVQPNVVEVRIYPNPANETISIGLEDPSGYRISLVNPDGKIISAWKDVNFLDVSRIPVGLYVLEGISDLGIFRERVVISR